MWSRPLSFAFCVASTLAIDTGEHGQGYTSRWDTTYNLVPSSKTKYHDPTYTAPAPPNSYPHTNDYTKGYTKGYNTKDYTKSYTKDHTIWVETKTYAHPTYIQHSYKPEPTVPSLEDALINAGCSKFLAFIKSDADTWALYNSPRVRTVFAPEDVSFNVTHARLLRRDLTPEQQQQADLSAEAQLTDLSKLRVVPGAVIETNNNAANLLGSPQVVVSEVNPDTGGVKIASGLGNEIDVKATDISYTNGVTNGLIHTTSDLPTNPLLLSSTVLANPDLSTFGSLLAGVGTSNLTTRQTQKLDFTPRVTVFIPTNEAFKNVGGSISPGQIAAVLDDHAVVASSVSQAVGYLPNLQNGASVTTEGGTSLPITVRDGDYYVGGAKILQANIILTNGVAHVVDKVLSRPIHTAAAVPGTVPGAGCAALVAAGVVAMAMPSW